MWQWLWQKCKIRFLEALHMSYLITYVRLGLYHLWRQAWNPFKDCFLIETYKLWDMVILKMAEFFLQMIWQEGMRSQRAAKKTSFLWMRSKIIFKKRDSRVCIKYFIYFYVKSNHQCHVSRLVHTFAQMIINIKTGN